MRFGYADSPYLGCCRLYGHFHGDDGRCWDDPETHRLLVERMNREFPDGWALSLKSDAGELAQFILWAEADGKDVRVMPWVKPFCAFKPGVNPAYAWEPIIFKGGRKRTRQQPTVRDWVSANITLKKGLTGAKPPAVAEFICDVLNVQPGDEVVDLFTGTGGCGVVFAERTRTLTPSEAHAALKEAFGAEV